MAAPRLRQQVADNESSTRIKQGDTVRDGHEGDVRSPYPSSGKVKMNIPPGMPKLPGGRTMPPLPMLLSKSLAPIRRSLAPLRKSLAPRPAAPAPVAVEELRAPQRRWPLVVTLLLFAVAGIATWLILGRS